MNSSDGLKERLRTGRITSPHLKPIGQWTRNMTTEETRQAMCEALNRITQLEAAMKVIDEECGRAADYATATDLAVNIQIMTHAALHQGDRKP